MPTVTASLTITYGDSTGTNITPWRQPFTFSFAYTEESVKTVQIAASTTDFPVTLDTVGTPKFVFVQAVETDVTVKLSDGTDDVPTTLTPTSGWFMICNPNGQAVKRFLVTTPASPTTGARVRVLAFE